MGCGQPLLHISDGGGGGQTFCLSPLPLLLFRVVHLFLLLVSLSPRVISGVSSRTPSPSVGLQLAKQRHLITAEATQSYCTRAREKKESTLLFLNYLVSVLCTKCLSCLHPLTLSLIALSSNSQAKYTLSQRNQGGFGSRRTSTDSFLSTVSPLIRVLSITSPNVSKEPLAIIS